jgi:lipoprotein-anchoring transpeptidase ErfK/SrfK
MKKLMHIRWLEWTITLCAIVAVAIMLSVSGAQAERVFAGAPAARAKVGIRVAANASVPRTHGPVSKEIIDFATNEPVGTIIISNEERTLIRVLPYVPPGPYNPLGARALYLHSGGRDTLYRIHGTNDSATLGGYETSGCFRLSNSDVMDLFTKVKVGTKVIVK